MPISNSATSYGTITKGFHWLTALMILSSIPLGIIASNLAQGLRDPSAIPDQATVALTATLFSLHKTLGVSIFAVALLRILWALSQPKPGLLNGDHRSEAWLAETVHWLLYGSLVLVPLTGWIHHAATTGFAPIWWPFGQDLPFVPKDPALAELTNVLHYILQWVLIGAIGLHIAGALKHHVIDKDATLRRMLPGRSSALPTKAQPGHTAPAITAIAIWLATLGGANMLGWFAHESDAKIAPALQQVESDWQVKNGELMIAVTQLGSKVTGQFANWTATITYDETPDADGRHGAVEITINTATLSLGSVTKQALGLGYLEAQNFPTASFRADILSTNGAHMAQGTLTIRDQTIPLDLPFDLKISGDEAVAHGQVSVDRRDLGIGMDVTAEGSLGFTVGISFTLTARRG